MEYLIFDRLSEEIKANRRAALATITRTTGSIPGREGFMMGIFEDGSTAGTVGGGTLEFKTIEIAKECMAEGKGGYYKFELNDTGELGMKCGGEVELYIKVFSSVEKLLIVGGGHISLELYKIGRLMGFYTVIFEDREEYANNERFPEADEIIVGNIDEKLRNYGIDDKCYIVIVTRGHAFDELGLRAVIESNAAYIGMIGSRSKTNVVINHLKDSGFSEERINRVYAPVGIAIANEKPNEIALGIMAEIICIKNNGKLEHMKNVK